MNTCTASSASQVTDVARTRTFQVWLADPPAFLSSAEHMAEVHISAYALAGAIRVSGGDDTADLETVFERTQNIDKAWNAAAPCRSLSVGDLVCEALSGGAAGGGLTGRSWLVQPIGFVEVVLDSRPLPSFDEALANGYCVHRGGPDDGKELQGRFWWTLCRGWPEAEVSPNEWDTETEAQRAACLALLREQTDEGPAAGAKEG